MSFIKEITYAPTGWLASHPVNKKRLNSTSKISIEPAKKKRKTFVPSSLPETVETNPFEEAYETPLLQWADQMGKLAQAEKFLETTKPKSLKEQIKENLYNTYVAPFKRIYYKDIPVLSHAARYIGRQIGKTKVGRAIGSAASKTKNAIMAAVNYIGPVEDEVDAFYMQDADVDETPDVHAPTQEEQVSKMIEEANISEAEKEAFRRMQDQMAQKGEVQEMRRLQREENKQIEDEIDFGNMFDEAEQSREDPQQKIEQAKRVQYVDNYQQPGYKEAAMETVRVNTAARTRQHQLDLNKARIFKMYHDTARSKNGEPPIMSAEKIYSLTQRNPRDKHKVDALILQLAGKWQRANKEAGTAYYPISDYVNAIIQYPDNPDLIEIIRNITN